MIVTNRIFAHDAGVLWTKATDGKGEYAQPSVVGNKETLLADPGNEYVAIHEAGEALFVGHAAVEQSRFKRWLRQDDKVASPEYRTMLLASAGIVLGPGQHRVHYAGGLPLAHWNQKDALLGVLNKVSGVAYSVSQGERQYTTSLHIADALILPQPYGSLADASLDDSGQALGCAVQTRRGTMDLANCRVMVVEIGSHTAHLLVVDRMKPLVGESKSLPYGIATAYEAIGAAMNGLPAWEVDRRLMGGTLRTDGAAFRELAAAITAEARGLNANVDLYFVSGGGGQRLYSHLLEREPKILHSRAFTGNLWGFFELGGRKWNRGTGVA